MKISFFFTILFLLLFFPKQAFAQTPPLLLYQSNAPTYNWTVGFTTYTGNKNPFNFEVYACSGQTSFPLRDACISTARTSGGQKWWTNNGSWNGYPCTILQASYDGPRQSSDTRTTNGRANSSTQLCSSGSRAANPFVSVSMPFTYDTSYCSGGQGIVLSPRSDPYSNICRTLNTAAMVNNPSAYSQDQRNCMMFADDRLDFTACKGSTCRTHTYQPTDGTESFAQPTDRYENVCDAFTQGNGTYTVSLNLYDVFGSQYANSSFWLTWLNAPPSTFTIGGNVFVDNNKNGVKDGGESNYTGPITITSSAGTIATSNGTYTVSNLNAGSTTVRYTNLPTGYSLTYPLNGPPPSHQVTVGASCATNGAVGATCSGGNISNLNFGITNSVPWIQTYDSDVRFDNGFTNPIPATSVYPLYALAVSSGSLTPGVLFSGDSTVSLGAGQVSSTNWLAGGTVYPEVYSPSSGSLKTSYQQLVSTAAGIGTPPTDLTTLATCRNLTNCSLPANLPSGIYQGNGNVTLNTFTAPVDNNYVFLINGSLTLNGNITLPVGSTALFSAAQDIIIPQTLGIAATAPLPQAQLQGFFVAGRNFIVQGSNNCVTGPDNMLNMAGAIIVNANGTGGAFINQRDLCANNPSYPSFTIQARPDFILRAPSFLMKKNTSFLEEAP